MVLQGRGIGSAVLMLAFVSGPALADGFETRLAPSPLTDGTRINIAGEGQATASLDGARLTVSGAFHGLPTPATTAQLYDGLGIGIPGPKAFDLTVTQGPEGTLSGTVTLTPKQASVISQKYTRFPGPLAKRLLTNLSVRTRRLVISSPSWSYALTYRLGAMGR